MVLKPMKTPQTSLTMIVRDCARLMSPCLTSAAPAVDEVVLVDTGSLDDTVDVSFKVLKGLGVPLEIVRAGPNERPDLFLEDSEELGKRLGVPGPFTGLPMLANYGAARQLGWNRCRGKAVMWLDSDDVLVGAEAAREVAARVVGDGFGAAMLWYDYNRDAGGNTTCLLRRERIASPNAKWHQPIHEVLVPVGPCVSFEQPRVVHRAHGRAGVAIHWRNLKIMLSSVQESESKGEAVDPRMLFYLGSEVRAIDSKKAVTYLEEYCRRSGWSQERALARFYLGQIAEERGDHDAAFVQFAASAAENNESADGHMGLMRTSYMKQRYHEASAHGTRALTLAKKSVTGELLQHDPTGRLTVTPRYLVPSLVGAGRPAEAAVVAREAIPRETDEQERKNLEFNLRLAEHQVSLTSPAPLPSPSPEATEAAYLALLAVEVWRHLVAEGDLHRATNLLRCMPPLAAQYPKAKEALDYGSRLRVVLT